MGTVSLPDIKRDRALISDYLAKDGKIWVYSITELGVKYARKEGDKLIPLTATRIHQILDKHGIAKKRIKKKKKAAKK